MCMLILCKIMKFLKGKCDEKCEILSTIKSLESNKGVKIYNDKIIIHLPRQHL